MTITLPPDLEQSLEEEARRRGTTPERLALDSLREKYGRPAAPEVTPSEESGTLYDLLAPYLGTWDGPAETLSEETGRRFGEIVEEKYARRSEKRRAQ